MKGCHAVTSAQRPALLSHGPNSWLALSAGAFVDDYRLDEGYRNDLAFLFCCHIAGGRPAWLELVPTHIMHTWQVRWSGHCPLTALAWHAG